MEALDKQMWRKYSLLATPQNENGGKYMTQLIAAICENGAKVVTVSDRMVSTEDMTLAFEHEERKVDIITDRTLVLTAGTIHQPDLIRDARQKAKGKERVREIADLLKEEYQKLRTKYIEDEILRPLAGLDSFEEYQHKQKMLHDSVVLEMNERIRRYSLELTLLLAGVDEQGHITRIMNPGIWRSFDNLSYLCIGMGERHADNVFAWYRYSPTIPLNDALYIAFEAKKKAEMAGGVGKITDIVIIGNDGIAEVKGETTRELEEEYNEREARGQRRGFGKRITELTIQTKPVETP